LGRESRFLRHPGHNLFTISKIQVFCDAESSAILLPEHQILLPEHQILLPEHQILLPEHQILLPEHHILLPEHQILLPEHQILLPEHQILLPEHQILLPEHQISGSSYTSQDHKIFLYKPTHNKIFIKFSYSVIENTHESILKFSSSSMAFVDMASIKNRRRFIYQNISRPSPLTVA
jgi:hypothetical protein